MKTTHLPASGFCSNEPRSFRGLGLAAILALPFLTPAVVFSQATPHPSEAPRSMDMIDRSDRNFLEEASVGGLKEVTIAQAVMPRLTNPAVRTYADAMLTAHTAVNAELRNLAEKKGVVLPVADPTGHVKEWGAENDDADEDFIDEMIDDHEDAIDRYENATRSKDADIAAFAQKTLPALRRHLQQAESIKKALR